MFYNCSDPVRYSQIESAVMPILIENEIYCSGIRAESQKILNSLFFVLSKDANTRDNVEWDFYWEPLEELELRNREPILFMKADKYTDSLLCMDRLEVNPKYRGLGINPTVQEFVPAVLSELSENYILDVAIHLDFSLTSYFIKQNRYALHEIQDITPKFHAIDEYYSIPAHVSIGFNPNCDPSSIVQSEFIGLDLDERLAYYALLSRFVDSVTSILTRYYNDPTMVSERNRKFLFNVLDISGFNRKSIEAIKHYSPSISPNRNDFFLFQNFKMYFAENYYKISQRLGMISK